MVFPVEVGEGEEDVRAEGRVDVRHRVASIARTVLGPVRHVAAANLGLCTADTSFTKLG